MKKCSDECTPLCDFCRMFNPNEERISGHYVYVGKGYCVYHEKPTDPTNDCDEFICRAYKVNV